ncbi:hypothetical protein [Rhizosphaericola mali]|uniref:Uncharacterized protein n=1 Tax=Rhizosphaericola mali TaxID=2545455 RepID=A0A5P2FY38_9BACT|nr:hypothetical protein [Rhizosphaericola mali]QES88105.1 hypothetical protein E0W69_005300 [Rhizosphaericola mali]
MTHIPMNMKFKILFYTLIMFISIANGQVIDLRTNFQQKNVSHDLKGKNDFLQITNDSTINYTKLLKYCYEKEMMHDKLDYNDIQNFSILGMFNEIEAFNKKKYLETEKNLHPIFEDTVLQSNLISLDTLVLKNKEEKVIILNDCHYRMETRALFLSKLRLFKECGFTHLAMEAFSDLSENVPGFKLGYYFQEPIMAEIFREAKRLGFQFVAYDDYSSLTEGARDSLQALNLFKEIQKLKTNEKLLVFSGMSHMAEDIPMKPDLMGSILKTQFKINPLTIDLFRGLVNEVNTDIVIHTKGLIDKGGIYEPDKMKTRMGFTFMDYFYIFPYYKNLYNRPYWLTCGGLRKHIALKCMQKKKCNDSSLLCRRNRK